MHGETYIPDPIERAEANAERLLDELKYSFEDGTMECVECRKRCSVWDMLPAGPHPDAPPICRECCPDF